MKTWHVLLSAFYFFISLSSLYADKVEVAEQKPYKGPVVCKGTKPVLFRNDVPIDGGKKLKLSDADVKKQLFEPYWEQFHTHVKSCQIIVGNLIIPHLHGIPFEKDRVNEAIKDIEEITGYLYIYDVDVDLHFPKLRVIHGNELLDFNEKGAFGDIPAKFKTETVDNFKNGFAIFVEKFTKELSMPQLKLIGDGRIGFLNSPRSCAFDDKYGKISIEDLYDYDEKNKKDKFLFEKSKILINENSHSECKSTAVCEKGCDRCFGSTKGQCQNINLHGCKEVCKPFGVNRCAGRDKTSLFCCYYGCRGGCIEATSHTERETSKCVACFGRKYLNWDTKKCTDECSGVIIDGTRICLPGNVCPDYMFKHSNGRFCSYSCPENLEFDPARLYRDAKFADFSFDKYWPDADSCRPCRMRFNTVSLDFENDCGIGCVVQTNSLSYFSILNIYPRITSVFDFEFNKFDNYLKQHYGAKDSAGFSDRERCRYIYGSLRLDHNSVGYPADRVRLTPYHLKILTFATSLYGNIRIENTESFWFADMFRNLIAIAQPRKGRKAPDTDDDVVVQYNSDLRTVDLQRLKRRQGKIVVKNNPLYIPPKSENRNNVFGDASTEVVAQNGLEKTRTDRNITYATGCTNKDSLSYYYRRCLQCGVNEFRVFQEKHQEYFALCEDSCDLKKSYAPTKYDEKLCEDCYVGCNQVGCRGSTPFECGKEFGKVECNADALKVDDPSIEMCVEGKSGCPPGFFKEEKRGKKNQYHCKRCNKACRGGCNDNGEAINFLRDDVGCNGCGIIYYDDAVNELRCMDLGVPPRCNQDDSCDMQDTNPVYEYWTQLKNKDD